MFKKPVWDDLSFVTWCIILLELASEDVYCSHKGMDMASNNTQVQGRAETFGGAGAQNIKGAHETRL